MFAVTSRTASTAESKAAASRLRAEIGPFSQNASPLTTKNGSAPRTDRAARTPPPVSSRCSSRSRTVRGGWRPLRKVDGDGLGLPVGVDGDGPDASVDQVIQGMVQQGAPAQRQQWLGGGVGQRAHAGPQAGGQDHGGVRRNGHAAGVMIYVRRS